jgi:hypothetical protein
MKNKPASAKAAKRPSGKNSELKATKRGRFVAGLIEGKSMRRAALDAGYSQSMADNAGHKILPGAREEFKQELARRVPYAKLVQRIVEGLNARELKLAQFEGEYTDKRYLVDYSERRRYAELVLKLFGYLKEQAEITGTEDAPPLNFNLTVKFRDSIDGRPVESEADDEN